MKTEWRIPAGSCRGFGTDEADACPYRRRDGMGEIGCKHPSKPKFAGGRLTATDPRHWEWAVVDYRPPSCPLGQGVLTVTVEGQDK